MSTLAQPRSHTHPQPQPQLRDHCLPFGLAAGEAQRPSADMPRWEKVLQASQDLDAGRYDDEALIDARLDACMDRLLADVCAAE